MAAFRIAALLMLAGPPPTAPSAPAAPPAGDLGRYAVKSAAGRTICILTLSYEPSVGGEVQPSPHCPAPLADAARWWEDDGGSITMEDVLHRRVGRIIENESLLELELPSGTRLDVDKPDDPPERTPTQRMTGSYTVYGGDPGTPLCHIRFLAGGRIGAAPGCPAGLARFAGGRWTSNAERTRLVSPQGAVRIFTWSDPISLDSADRSLSLGWDVPGGK